MSAVLFGSPAYALTGNELLTQCDVFERGVRVVSDDKVTFPDDPNAYACYFYMHAVLAPAGSVQTPRRDADGRRGRRTVLLDRPEKDA